MLDSITCTPRWRNGAMSITSINGEFAMLKELTVDEEMLVSGGVASGEKGTSNTLIYCCNDETGKCNPDGDMLDPT